MRRVFMGFLGVAALSSSATAQPRISPPNYLGWFDASAIVFPISIEQPQAGRENGPLKGQALVSRLVMEIASGACGAAQERALKSGDLDLAIKVGTLCAQRKAAGIDKR